MPDDRLVISITETAKRLQIGRSLAYRLVQSGEIPSIAIGGRRLVPIEALAEWIKACTKGGAADG